MSTGTATPFRQRRRVLPLLDRVDRGLIEQGNRPERSNIGDSATLVDAHLHNYDSLDARLVRKRGILGWDILDPLRWRDRAAGAVGA